MPIKLARVRLKPREERRILNGHLWIYSNEIDTTATPLKQFILGELVLVENSRGATLALGYINPQNLLAIRILTKESNTIIDENFFLQRFQQALTLRQHLCAKPFYRLIYGESDGLPGLIVDRFGDVLVVQFNTAGMENLRPLIIAALTKLFSPKTIILNNSSSQRVLEHLENKENSVIGAMQELVEIEENNARFLVPVINGQKTGWFYDHRDNRARLLRYVKNKKILDVFSYLGAWGIVAAKAGAQSVLCIDRSATALDLLQQNAKLNQVNEKITIKEGEAFALLKQLVQQKERFDIIILDPPAFIKKRKDLKEGQLAYQRLNELALTLLNKEGLLVTASCSLHFSQEMLIESVRKAAVKTAKQVQILEQGQQAPDHPIHPAIPETAYLKALFCWVV